MTQETINKIQQLTDEYCMCEMKKQMIVKSIKDANREMSAGEAQTIKELIILQSDNEKEIMQTLVEKNKEKVQQTISKSDK